MMMIIRFTEKFLLRSAEYMVPFPKFFFVYST